MSEPDIFDALAQQAEPAPVSSPVAAASDPEAQAAGLWVAAPGAPVITPDVGSRASPPVDAYTPGPDSPAMARPQLPLSVADLLRSADFGGTTGLQRLRQGGA